jgi:hypothetical protein
MKKSTHMDHNTSNRYVLAHYQKSFKPSAGALRVEGGCEHAGAEELL